MTEDRKNDRDNRQGVGLGWPGKHNIITTPLDFSLGSDVFWSMVNVTILKTFENANESQIISRM